MCVVRIISLLAIGLCIVPGLRADLQVNVQNDGQYSIAVDGKVWLRSGPTFFNKDDVRWSTDVPDKALVLNSTSNVTSGGYVTNWIERQFTYTYGNGTDTVRTAIRTFAEADTVIFTQTFLTGSNSTSLDGMTSFNETMSGFPSFQVADGQEDLGFLSFGGSMFGDTDKTMGRFTHSTTNINDGIDGGPLAIFNKKGQTVVISPYNNFMAASMWHVKQHGNYLNWGIMGGVDSIPANFTHKTIIRYGNTINEAFKLWGETMASQFHNVYDSDSRAGNQSQDISLNYLGYWTDKGSFYYYHTEDNTTYEDTLKDVRAHADNNSIPYRYVQLDSWWYPKDTTYQAVTSWTPMKSVFPHGLKQLHDATQWSFVAHNRIWSKATSYAKKYHWIVGKNTSLPHDLNFWRDLFKTAKAWGLSVYEQDWLNKQTLYMTELQTSLTLGRDWLMQMGQAAAEQGLTIQYCDATPRHAYQSLEIPVVTQARVSYDYLQSATSSQWRIGVTSIFADAMRIHPFKDTFWTGVYQPYNPYGKTEQFPDLEAAVASLSMGPVGPSDGIGNTNRDLLMKCCREDGVLLKPSKPAKALDKQIITEAFSHPQTIGEIWGTYTDVKVNRTMTGRYGILFGADISQSMVMTIQDLWFDLPENGVYYPYNNPTRWQYYNTSTVLDLRYCSTANFCLYYFSPLLQSSIITAVLGETEKWIPMAPKRFENIIVASDYVTVTLTGALGESVSVHYILDDQLFTAHCKVSKYETKTDCNLIWASISSRAGPGAMITESVCFGVALLVAIWNSVRI